MAAESAEFFDAEAQRHPVESRTAANLDARAAKHRRAASTLANRLGLTGSAAAKERPGPSALRLLAADDEYAEPPDHEGRAAYRRGHPEMSLDEVIAALEHEQDAVWPDRRKACRLPKL